MAEDSTTENTEQPTDQTEDASTATDDGTSELGDAGKQALDRMKAERNEAKKQAQTLQRELEKIRQASMSEQEKAVAEAEARGRTAAATEYSKRLARTEFDALAGRRNADFDTAQALEYVDLAKFLDENGEPDTKAIKAAVERLVPAAQGGPASFDGGARTTAKSTDFNQVLRQAAGRA